MFMNITNMDIMLVLARVMDRDLVVSSVHVSHRQTFSEWYIHKVQMVGS